MAVPARAHQQRLNEAAYVLRITTTTGANVPVPGHPIAGNDGLLALMLPPQSFRPSQAARIGVMDTLAGSTTDEQGASPPTWDLAGQFRLASTRVGNTILDHGEQQRALEAYVRFYLDENKRRARAFDELVRMEFHDFYADEHWVVAPLTIPLGERDSSRPNVERWSLRLRGLQPTTRIERPPDPVADALAADPNAAIAALCPIENTPPAAAVAALPPEPDDNEPDDPIGVA